MTAPALRSALIDLECKGAVYLHEFADAWKLYRLARASDIACYVVRTLRGYTVERGREG